MNKTFVLSLIITSAILTGCNNQDQARNNNVTNAQTVNDVLESKTPSNQTDNQKNLSDSQTSTGNPSDTGIITNNAEAVSKMINNTTKTTAKTQKTSTYEYIDVDLTTMSSTMIYSEVSNMMTNASAYTDKVIKMKGYTNIFKDEMTGNVYYSCIVPDATACCAQGIEFVLNDKYQKYDDYPLDNEEVTIIGIFSKYIEDGMEYYTLRKAELLTH